MLFILTGTAQTGKTRWLQRVVNQLRGHGVPVYGVLAPGQWRTYDQNNGQNHVHDVKKLDARKPCAQNHDAACSHNNTPCFKKLGIDNILLPQNKKIAFATRATSASTSNVPSTPNASGSKSASETSPEAAPACSQSAQAKLGWAIDDAAIDAVNAHFCWMCGLAKDCRLPEDIKRATGVTAQAPALLGLLVVDEIGPLELLHGGGLTSAMDVLMQGPSLLCAHAVVVVRESLCETAAARFADCWGEIAVIHPTEPAAQHIHSLFTTQSAPLQ